jgi:hypothetical protein
MYQGNVMGEGSHKALVAHGSFLLFVGYLVGVWRELDQNASPGPRRLKVDENNKLEV